MQKKQVVAIHGGGEFVSLEGKTLEAEIASRTVSLDRMRQRGSWKSNLQEDLGDAYDVISPRMPQPDTPTYSLWKAYFDKIVPLLNADVALVGHSLGGIFLVKYLGEEEFPKNILGLFLVAAPFNDDTNAPFHRAGFSLETHVVERLADLNAPIFIYHSEDDVVVPVESAKRYHALFPHARLALFSDRGHFNGEHFPELVADIRAL